MKKIILATDHAGFELKERMKIFLQGKGYEVIDKGALHYDEDDDYPDFIIPAAREIAKTKSMGIIFGGSGQGEAISANKVKGIRAAVYNTNNPELARLARTHNNANVLSIGARFVSEKNAIKAAEIFLSTEFSREKRHIRRIRKIEK